MSGVKLRRRLFLLAAVAIVPLAVTSGFGLFVLAKQQQTQTERAALEISRALLTGVDAELGRLTAVLQTLASSPLVDNKNFQAYHELLRRIVGTQPHWLAIVLARPDMTSVLNTRFVYGSPLPDIVERETFEQIVRRATPVIGYLIKDPTGNIAFAVRVPIVKNGKLLYVLTGIVKPESILEVMKRQRLPDDWVASAFDTKNVRVARSRGHFEFLGMPASDTLKALMDRPEMEGTGMAITSEGQG
ncbi:MAG TPA: cache domain-containing protein, partial [Burkholderiales bacterium]|nr:cache domain-containing protein [Burkholderiales bacterium]